VKEIIKEKCATFWSFPHVFV